MQNSLVLLLVAEHGRKAVISLNGVEITQRFIQMCPADKKFDNNLANATNVFLKCVSKGELPVSSTRGAYTFQMPERESSDSSSGTYEFIVLKLID